MSDYFKKITTSKRHQNLQWVNSMVNTHDLVCQCDEPLKHIILTIRDQEPNIKFNKEESTKLQQWLTTGDDQDGDAIDGLGDGDLERLFEEDFTADDEDGG